MENTIYLDARLYQNSGIGTYIANLIDQYQNLTHPPMKILIPSKIGLQTQSDNLHFQPYNTPIYSLTEQLSWLFKIPRNTILHVPHYNAPLLYPGKLIVTVHDICHAVMREFFSKWYHRIYAEYYFKKVLLRADTIITVSNFSKQEIINYFKIPAEKITVIYNGIADKFSPRTNIEIDHVKNKYHLPPQYLLFIGNIKPHKNIAGLIHAYYQAMLENNHLPPLVMSGEYQKIIQAFPDLTAMINYLSFNKKIFFTGFILDEDLPSVYSGATILLLPSLYEGFGFPVLEAMACGTVVITSNVASLPEIAGEAAYLVDPLDYSQITQAILRLANNSEQRKNLIHKGFQQVKLFNWKKAAEEHLSIYTQF